MLTDTAGKEVLQNDAGKEDLLTDLQVKRIY